MSSSDNHIDKTFKSKLAEQKFIVPEAFVADMQQKLAVAPVTKRNGAWLWFLLGLSAIGLVTLFWFNSYDSEFLESDKNHQALVSNSNIQDKTYTNQNQKGKLNNDNTITEIKSDQIEINQTATDDSVATSIDSDILQLGLATEKLLKDSHLPKNVEKVKHDITEDNSTVGNKEILKYKDIEHNSSDVSRIVNDDLSKEEKQRNSILLNEEDRIDELITVALDDTTKPKIKYVYRDSIVIRDSVVIRDSIVVRDSVILKDSVIESPSQKDKWELQLFGGVSKLTTNYMVTPELASIYESASEKINSPLFGFNLGYNLGKIGVQTGVNYGEYGAKYSINQYSVSSYDTVVDNSYFQNLFDSTGQVYDSTYIFQLDTLMISDTLSTNQLNYTNSYSAIKIPLRLSYAIEVGKWQFVPYFGVNFNFTIGNSTGTYLQNSEGSVMVAIAKPFSMSYQTSLQIRREMGAFHLFCEPIYSGSLIPLIDKNTTQVKYSQFGVRLGMGVKF